MDKASGIIFLLKVPDRLSLPDAHGSGAVFLPDMKNLLGNLVESRSSW
jgi:hypothetical protein